LRDCHGYTFEFGRATRGNDSVASLDLIRLLEILRGAGESCVSISRSARRDVFELSGKIDGETIKLVVKAKSERN